MSRYKPDRDSIKAALKEDAALRREGYVTPESVEALVERVRAGVEAEPFMLGKHSASLAALTELAERVKAAEFSLQISSERGSAYYREIEEVVAQRDELVEALKKIDAGRGSKDDLILIASATLAKVRGEAGDV